MSVYVCLREIGGGGGGAVEIITMPSNITNYSVQT